MKWNGWGDPAAAKPLSDGIRSLLEQALGVSDTEIPAPEIDEVRVLPSALTTADRDALSAIVGDGFVLVDDVGRLLRAGGKSDTGPAAPQGSRTGRAGRGGRARR